MTPHGERPLAAIDRYLLPADARSPLRFLLDDMLVAHGRGERWRQRLARWAPTAFARRLVATRVERGAVATSGQPFAAALALLAAALALPLPGLDGHDVAAADWVLLRDPGRGRQRAVLFLFRAGAKRPFAVVKVAAVSSGHWPLHAEAGALSQLQHRGDDELRQTLPVLLGYDERRDGVEILTMSYRSGRSAYVDLAAGRHAPALIQRHFIDAASWLAHFHVLTRTRREVGPEPDPLTRFGGENGIPVSSGHGDFWPRNLLHRSAPGAGVAVVDWEAFRQVATPLADLLHYPLTYGLCFPWQGGRRLAAPAAARRTFLGGGTVALAVRAYFAHYCAAAGLDPALIRPALATLCTARAAEPGAGPAAGDWSELAGDLLR